MTDLAERAPHSRSESLLDVVRERAERDPHAVALRFLSSGEYPGRTLTSIELDTRARAIASELQDRRLGGDRALLLLPGGMDFLVAFFGCLYAGVAAVPCAPPSNADSSESGRIARVAEDADVGAVLMHSTMTDPAYPRGRGDPLSDDVARIEVDRVAPDAASLWKPPLLHGTDLAMLQYTSGSTGDPKGVAVTADNLAAQLVNFRDLAGLPAGGNVVSWMPLHHALGLGHVLLAQFVGGEGVFMNPDDFVAQPHRWLEAITATEGPIFGGGPNFAYQRCVDLITPQQREQLDLSGWHAALIGGERLRPHTLRRFADLFVPCGFRTRALFPAYGLTETMQIVTAGPGTAPEGVELDAVRLEQGHAAEATGEQRSQAFVPCGAPGPRANVHIVDPETGAERADNAIGEVWIEGPVVCREYWRKPEATENTFGAMLDDGRGPFLRTGDLGFLRGGELVICGRLKELVIVNGRNMHPQDIEQSAQRVSPDPALPAAAFATEVDEQEQLVVVQTVPGTPDSARHDLAAVAERLRQAVTSDHQVAVHEILLVEPGQIPTTHSGKVRRGNCRESYQRGELRTVARSAAPEDVDRTATETHSEHSEMRNMVLGLAPELRSSVISTEVRRRVAHACGTSPEELPGDQQLAGLGIESLRTIELRHSLQRDFGVTLPTAEFFRSTVTELGELIDRGLDGGGSSAASWPTLTSDPDNRFEPFPLTGLQHAYLVGRAATYELSGTSIHLYAEHDSPELDLPRLQRALDTLVQRQEMLRAVVSADGYQRILAEVPSVPIAEYDLRDADERAVQHHLDAMREEMGHQVIPLDTWPMFDIRVTWMEGNHARVHVSLDLLIFDVASVRLFFLEWGDLYRDPNTQLPPVDVSFRDFVLAAEHIADTDEYQRSRDYWMDRIATLPPSPELPSANSAEQLDRPIRQRRHDRLDAQRWQRLKEHAAELGVTPTSVLLAAYATALGAWSRSSHFTIDVPLFSRFPLHPHIDNILGDFTSVSLLEVDLRSDEGIGVLAQRLQHQMWRDLEHRYFSGVEVMREAARARGVPPSAFASVVFASTREHGRDQAFEQGEWGSKWLGELVYGITQTPQVLLDHQVYERDGALTFNWDAVERLFAPGVLDDMFATYLRLLHELADHEHTWEPGGFDPLPRAHRELIDSANDTAGPAPAGYLFSGIVEQAATHPQRPAVITSMRKLTFAELHGHACRLAWLLREAGAVPNRLVAVATDKSAEQIVAALAVQLAGAAYLPLDPDLPTARQDHLLSHGEVSLVLTRAQGPDRDWPEGVTRFVVDLDEPVEQQPAPQPAQQPTDLAYVLYTSGSTGEPKGVMQTHRATLNTLVDANERMRVGPDDRVLGLSELSFDLSVWDVFGALGAGAALVLPEPEAQRDPARWLELMAQHGVTVWNSVPALMGMLVEHLADTRQHPGTDELRAVWFSGDWIPIDLPDRVREIAPKARIIASGGPTETAIWCVVNQLGEIDPQLDSIPYGRPMRNHTIHVLDDRLEECPLWCPGEMYIGGIGLAEGYWRDPERTRSAFITHPRTGERLYRSGDTGRWLDTGELEILGRSDDQLKVGGFRIEPGEIESTLVRHEAVRAAAVTAAGNEHRRLVAFVVPEDERDEVTGDDGEDVLGAEITDPAARLEHKLALPGRRTDLDGSVTELTDFYGAADGETATRSSHREFGDRAVPLEDLARLLERLRGLGEGPLPKYRYGSAGSLYPVQTYVYTAPGGVEGLGGGTYYHDPVAHRLVTVSDTRLNPDIHVPDNRALFRKSAFTVVLVAQNRAIEPLYGSRSRDFCLIEAGLISQLLEEAAADCDIGLCQVGLIRETHELRQAFDLDDGHTVLHGLIGGARVQATGVSDSTDAAGNERNTDTAEQLRSYLGERLPRYMVPATVSLLDRLPLTPRGKLDRTALRRLADDHAGDGDTARAEHTPPANELERTITSVLQRVLDTDRIGVLDNFFDLGADSVIVVRAHRHLREELGRDYPLMTMFEHPNIRRLAQHLAEHDDSSGAAGASASTGFERANRRSTRRRRGSRQGRA
ncbi:amino acid adenylation domain-containing protein [Actinopolyspora mzabensis]|uniref:Phenyloxazoline synthase MbtB n=1 Tax=Actinopolyspora mzabensis TaxID=995066 RepID=A0A1G9EGJ5_ACTMZ|nr:non-ribosomal peptide synthetase [Actinopolyspora mzabensis]SDK75262.1 amino acid adenylation domain-containing protein [Actinopolyspora mzabensis]